MPVPRALVPRGGRRYKRSDRDQVPPMRRDQCVEAPEPSIRAPRASIENGQLLTWLYIPQPFLPSTALHSVLDMEAWSSASISQNPDTALFVSSSGKPMLLPPSWQGWKTRRWIVLLYGTTLSPSMAARGVAAFISSLPAIPASHSRRRAVGRARPTRAISGRMSGASSARRSLNGSFLKTCSATSIWDFPKSAESYESWAIASKRACSRRLRRALRIGVSASSCWPTPTASNNGNRVEIEIGAAGLSFEIPKGMIGQQKGPKEASKVWTLMWLTMQAAGFRPGKRREATFLSSHPLRVTLRLGTHASADTLHYNPRFTEWMMGWPIGWTSSGQQVTGYAAWLRRSRSELSRLISDFEASGTGGGELAPAPYRTA